QLADKEARERTYPLSDDRAAASATSAYSLSGATSSPPGQIGAPVTGSTATSPNSSGWSAHRRKTPRPATSERSASPATPSAKVTSSLKFGRAWTLTMRGYTRPPIAEVRSYPEVPVSLLARARSDAVRPTPLPCPSRVAEGDRQGSSCFR